MNKIFLNDQLRSEHKLSNGIRYSELNHAKDIFNNKYARIPMNNGTYAQIINLNAEKLQIKFEDFMREREI